MDPYNKIDIYREDHIVTQVQFSLWKAGWIKFKKTKNTRQYCLEPKKMNHNYLSRMRFCLSDGRFFP
jgi:hypothetical protein